MIDLDNLLNKLNEEEVAKKNNRENVGKRDENFLSFKAGNAYTVRLLPNVKNPLKTFTDYEEYGFPSVTGQGYIYAGRTARSIGRKDIIKELQWKTFSEGRDSGDVPKKERSYKLFPQEKEMVNVYVVNDPVDPENNGTVKILRYSAKTNKDGEPTSPLFKKIKKGVFEKPQIGKKAFDLSDKGRNLIIDVSENSGGWNDYSESEFDDASDLGLSEAEIAEILEQTFDLEEFIPEVKSDEEITKLLNEHWYGTVVYDTETETDTETDTDEIPMDFSKDDEVDVDDDVDDFLSDLDDLDNLD